MSGGLAIAGRPIGRGHPCFVIAEAGVNHNGDVDRARALIDAAAGAGADAVKFQSFSADRLVTPAAAKAAYQRRTTDPAESQAAMLRALELSPDAQRALFAHARARGIVFMSSPFDPDSADLLAALPVPAFKLGSGEITNLPFLAYVAGKGLPVILSTGMSTLDEVVVAVDTIRGAGCRALAVLHCVSDYPARPEDANLHAMATLAAALAAPVGFSDHTPGIAVALAAVALGAAIVEKHLTLDRTLPGPDHAASLEPAELAALVAGVRAVEAALGDGVKAPRGAELANREVARRSLAAAVDIAAGEVIEAGMVTALRPGTGIPPGRLCDVVGRRTRRAVAAHALLAWDDLA
jgi:N-acetylneuraminate synthase/N,N'-diacetyllegionaminate synthase